MLRFTRPRTPAAWSAFPPPLKNTRSSSSSPRPSSNSVAVIASPPITAACGELDPPLVSWTVPDARAALETSANAASTASLDTFICEPLFPRFGVFSSGERGDARSGWRQAAEPTPAYPQVVKRPTEEQPGQDGRLDRE